MLPALLLFADLLYQLRLFLLFLRLLLLQLLMFLSTFHQFANFTPLAFASMSAFAAAALYLSSLTIATLKAAPTLACKFSLALSTSVFPTAPVAPTLLQLLQL